MRRKISNVKIDFLITLLLVPDISNVEILDEEMDMNRRDKKLNDIRSKYITLGKQIYKYNFIPFFYLFRQRNKFFRKKFDKNITL